MHRSPLTQTSPTPQAKIAGVKYLYVYGDDESAYVKQGAEGVCFCKLKTCVIVAHHNDTVQPGQCRVAVQRLADFLKDSGI